MKSACVSLIAITLLSGCAYQEAVLSDKAAEQHPASQNATTITAPAPAPAQFGPAPNATSNAHKMIAPLTSF